MYLVSYDISSDRMRKKVSDCLLKYGRRIQYSVFECEINPKRYRKLYKELAKIAGELKDGNIRFYFIDETAKNKIEISLRNWEKCMKIFFQKELLRIVLTILH